MIRSPLAALACAAAVAAGCGSGPRDHPQTTRGSFTMLENAVEDLCATVLDERYRPTGDLGTDSDRMGMAFVTFQQSAEGGRLAADAAILREKIVELERLASGRAPIDRQREAARDLREIVEAIRSKL